MKILETSMTGIRIFPLRRARSGGIALALACSIFMMDAAEVTILPKDRTFTELRAGERNPFGQAAAVAEPTAMQEAETEEVHLRRVIGAIKVGGVSGSGPRARVLLGSLILKPGDTLPPLFENQQEVLMISSVSEKEVRLTFLEKDASSEPRQIVIPLRLAPQVSQLLYGEAFEKLANVGPDGRPKIQEVPLKGVQDFLKASEEAGLQNITERKMDMMGELKNDATPETEQ